MWPPKWLDKLVGQQVCRWQYRFNGRCYKAKVDLRVPVPVLPDERAVKLQDALDRLVTDLSRDLSAITEVLKDKG